MWKSQWWIGGCEDMLHEKKVESRYAKNETSRRPYLRIELQSWSDLSEFKDINAHTEKHKICICCIMCSYWPADSYTTIFDLDQRNQVYVGHPTEYDTLSLVSMLPLEFYDAAISVTRERHVPES
jgi:hypothetical protein